MVTLKKSQSSAPEPGGAATVSTSASKSRPASQPALGRNNSVPAKSAARANGKGESNGQLIGTHVKDTREGESSDAPGSSSGRGADGAALAVSGNSAGFISTASFKTARTEATVTGTSLGGGTGGSNRGLREGRSNGDDASTDEESLDDDEPEGGVTPTNDHPPELPPPIPSSTNHLDSSAPLSPPDSPPNRTLLSYLPSLSLPSVSLPSFSLPSSPASFSFLPKMPTFQLLSYSNDDGPTGAAGNDLHAVELRRQPSIKFRAERGETTEFVRGQYEGGGLGLPGMEAGKVSMDLRIEEGPARPSHSPSSSSKAMAILDHRINADSLLLPLHSSSASRPYAYRYDTHATPLDAYTAIFASSSVASSLRNKRARSRSPALRKTLDSSTERRYSLDELLHQRASTSMTNLHPHGGIVPQSQPHAATANGRTFQDISSPIGSSPLSPNGSGLASTSSKTSPSIPNGTSALPSASTHPTTEGPTAPIRRDSSSFRRKAASEAGLLSSRENAGLNVGGASTQRSARVGVSENGVLETASNSAQWKGKGKATGALQADATTVLRARANTTAASSTKSRKGLFGMFKKNRERSPSGPPTSPPLEGFEEDSGRTSIASRPQSMSLGRNEEASSELEGDAQLETLLDQNSIPLSSGGRMEEKPFVFPEQKEKVQFVKVKSKNKSIKSFDKLFLAQQLFIPFPQPTHNSTSPIPTPSANGTENSSIHSGGRGAGGENASQHSSNTPPTTEGAAPDLKRKAVWCCKWSNDGRYLATGGRDCLVRVWEVLSTPDARRSAMFPDPVDSQGCPVRVSSSESSTQANPASGKKSSKLRTPVATMPVFNSKPVYEFHGHTADVLDICWSKNDFLLSASMDKTVRLWHISRPECLCAFLHLDFVTSIAFHPKDDRFFLSGSLDCKLRLWNIPEKRVQVWTELPEFVTSVAFTSSGALAIAGIFSGHCMFFEVGTFRYHSQFAAKSSRGKNAKGSKVASMVALPIASSEGERLLVASNDSRVRLYGLAQKNVEAKYKGHENESSQITASFSDNGRWVISGSEDGHVYIWESGLVPNDRGGWSMRNKEDGSAFESFHASSRVVICANFAPGPTRSILSSSLDPIFSSSEYLDSAPRLGPAGSPSLTIYPTNRTASSRMSPTSTRNSFIGSMSTTSGVPLKGGAKDAIIVVADDSGTISVYRNSTVVAAGAGGSTSRAASING